MRILIVAATEPEIALVRSSPRGPHEIDLLVTGIGLVATAAQSARRMAQTRYDLAFNFGVCGSFDRSLAPGTVVQITADRMSELGAEDDDRFITMQELGLTAEDAIVNLAPPQNAELRQLPAVSGISVNTVHGSARTIAAVLERFHPQVESMEGAAFAYACALSGVPYAQVRAVSNIVERRHRDRWRLDLAIRNLNEAALRILHCA